MFLRLKSAALAVTGSTHPRASLPRTARAALRDGLLRRHYAWFDWSAGGPPPPVKFIDAHQLAYAALRARNGSAPDRAIVDFYRRAVTHLQCDDGSVCQYATGDNWNNHHRHVTLAGQAIALHTLALAAAFFPAANDRDAGHAIHAAVARGGLLQTAAACARLRDLAWYTLALTQFAARYADAALSNDARRIAAGFERFAPRATPRNAAGSAASAAQALDDAAAMFGLHVHRGATEPALAVASSLIASFALPGGGFGVTDPRPAVRETFLDIDCTIDIVLAAQRLARDSRAGQAALLVRHGMRVLRDPAIAHSRRSDSGILCALDASRLQADTPRRRACA